MFQRLGWVWMALAVVGGLMPLVAQEVAALDASDGEYQTGKSKEEADFVANCYRESLAEDMAKSRSELPVMPSKEERIRGCLADLPIAKKVGDLYPDPCRTKVRRVPK